MNKIKYEIFCHHNFLFFRKRSPVIKLQIDLHL